MKYLLKAALLNRKHYALLLVTLGAMLLLTLASQAEMLSLGVLAKSGPDMFTLFGKEVGGKLETVPSLSLEEVQERWQHISPYGDLSQADAHAYLAKHSTRSLVERLSTFLDDRFHIHDHLAYLAFILIGVAFFKAFSLFVFRYFTQVVSIRVSRDLRLRYFAHIQSLPLSFYHEYDIGALSSRVTGDAGIVANAINSMLINYIQMPFAVLTTLTACFLISWKLSLIIFFGFPILVFPIIFLAKKIKYVAKQMQKNQENFASVLLDFLSGIMTVKVFAMENFSYKKYREQNERMAKLQEKSARYGTASRPILHMISSLFFALIILVGLYIFRLAPAELLVFCGLLYVFYEPIKKFSEENAQIFQGIAAAERMYEVLERTSDVQDAANAIEMKGFTKEIEFKNVSFRYKEDWVLKDLNFKVKKGQMVALVGPTGSGKSSIVQLIPRLYDIQQGEILIDGHSVRAYTQRSLREHVAFVTQRPFLFLDSVQENICFGRNFSAKQMKEAARSAYADEFIQKLPGMYDFQLAESGKNLSGGQQQRLAIARALVKDAPILIMDEATSALDAVSENKIKEAIAEIHGSVTLIIVAHRLSTIANADHIIYLEQGKKMAEGTKDYLLEHSPQFRRMWELMMHSDEKYSEQKEIFGTKGTGII